MVTIPFTNALTKKHNPSSIQHFLHLLQIYSHVLFHETNHLKTNPNSPQQVKKNPRWQNWRWVILAQSWFISIEKCFFMVIECKSGFICVYSRVNSDKGFSSSLDCFWHLCHYSVEIEGEGEKRLVWKSVSNRDGQIRNRYTERMKMNGWTIIPVQCGLFCKGFSIVVC